MMPNHRNGKQPPQPPLQARVLLRQHEHLSPYEAETTKKMLPGVFEKWMELAFSRVPFNRTRANDTALGGGGGTRYDVA